MHMLYYRPIVEFGYAVIPYTHTPHFNHVVKIYTHTLTKKRVFDKNASVL